MLALSAASLSFAGSAMRPAVQPVQMSAMDDLKAAAAAQNPAVGFWDPLSLSELNFWGQGEEATIGFLRQAEIKHGRVAMAAFVGYCVQSAGLKWPYEPFASIDAASPPEQWDALSEAAKLQIIVFVGFLEAYSEHSFILEKHGQKHYMRGGKPGYFPPSDSWPHPGVLNLYDPLNFWGNMTEEQKAKRLNMEVNNGRLAMFGIMGLVSEATVEGSVPLGPHLPHYAGDVMRPFANSISPFAGDGGFLGQW